MKDTHRLTTALVKPIHHVFKFERINLHLKKFHLLLKPYFVFRVHVIIGHFLIKSERCGSKFGDRKEREKKKRNVEEFLLKFVMKFERLLILFNIMNITYEIEST